MTRGLTRRQLGVTDAQVETFGRLILELSHNLQIRRGDPVRALDFDAIERQRADAGLTDAQIAQRIGLTPNQVTYIRNVWERRRFRTQSYHRLNQLGGGRRFRAERQSPPPPIRAQSSLDLRAAMRFDPECARRYIEAGWWSDDTLRAWLGRHASEHTTSPAVVFGDRTITYGELESRVRRLAAGLRAQGLGPGDVVGVQLANIPEYLEAYLAITWLGGVMTTLYMPHRAAEMEALLGFSGARMVICQSKAGEFEPARAVADLRARLPALERVVVVGGPVPATSSFAELADTGETPASTEPPVAADPFLLLFTSGTTAEPKAVPLSYHTMLSNARLSVPEHGIVARDSILCAAPFGHLYGLYSFHLALHAGAANVLLPAFSPPALAETVERHRPSVLFAAPAHMAACLQSGLLDRHDFSSLRLVVLSGSHLPRELALALKAELTGAAITQLWGMTELQAGLYTRPGDAIETAATSAGRPSPGTEARVVGTDDQPLGIGREGELQVRGCLLFPGYLNNDTANSEAFTRDGWFRTGDLAVMDQQGNVSISGRTKDVINRGGVKYNPREVEALLDRHPKVAQSAIVPIPDPVLGERACCFAIAAGAQAPTLDELCCYLLDQGISKVKLPERLELVKEMPLTPTRKVIKGKLKLAPES